MLFYIKAVEEDLLNGQDTKFDDPLAQYFRGFLLFQMIILCPLFPINFIAAGMNDLFFAEKTDVTKEINEEEL